MIKTPKAEAMASMPELRKYVDDAFGNDLSQRRLPLGLRTLEAQRQSAVQALRNRVKQEPNAVLSDGHPAAGAIASSRSSTENRLAVGALSLSLRASTQADRRRDWTALLESIEATDTLREFTAAIVENERSSFEFFLDRVTWKPSGLNGGNGILIELERSSYLSERVESRLRDSIAKQQFEGPERLGQGVWGTFLKQMNSQLALSSLSMGADGVASVRLNTPEFKRVTGRIPVRSIARSMATDPDFVDFDTLAALPAMAGR